MLIRRVLRGFVGVANRLNSRYTILRCKCFVVVVVRGSSTARKVTGGVGRSACLVEESQQFRLVRIERRLQLGSDRCQLARESDGTTTVPESQPETVAVRKQFRQRQ